MSRVSYASLKNTFLAVLSPMFTMVMEILNGEGRYSRAVRDHTTEFGPDIVHLKYGCAATGLDVNCTAASTASTFRILPRSTVVSLLMAHLSLPDQRHPDGPRRYFRLEPA